MNMYIDHIKESADNYSFSGEIHDNKNSVIIRERGSAGPERHSIEMFRTVSRQTEL